MHTLGYKFLTAIPSQLMTITYAIYEHRHRYATWAASRAASTKTCRFTVQQGKNIIEAVGLHDLLADPARLPEPAGMDSEHQRWRESAIKAAQSLNLEGFGHGSAAKLINVYCKGAFVCAGYEMHPKVGALHPPIDSLLLDELHANDVDGKRKVWAKARSKRWSKFSSDDYQSVIDAIRSVMQGRPLWQIEVYWRGWR